MFAKKWTLETMFQRHADGCAIVYNPAFQRCRVGDYNAGSRIFRPRVVLHMPELGIGRDLFHHLLPMFNRTVQTDQIAEIGINADIGKPHLLYEPNRAVSRTEIGILIHFQ